MIPSTMTLQRKEAKTMIHPHPPSGGGAVIEGYEDEDEGCFTEDEENDEDDIEDVVDLLDSFRKQTALLFLLIILFAVVSLKPLSKQSLSTTTT